MIDENSRRQLKEEGWCVFPEVLTKTELEQARAALQRGVEMQGLHDTRLDPNDANIRVYDLPALDPVFVEMLRRSDALEVVRDVLGPNVLVSNFTANIALPGSQSMNVHSDQALVVPAPWLQPWSMNIIWCLDDVYADNGGTLFLPGSHKFQSMDEVPPDARARMRAFEAPAGSFVAMEGRIWHTSGANITPDQQRRLMFAYYSVDFLRGQANWESVLPDDVKAGMDEETRVLFALGKANTRIGSKLTRLNA